MKLRPSPALLVAVLALVLSLAGTSYAAMSIGSAQIKNNSVKGKDVKDRSLTGKDIKDGSIKPADLAPIACPASDVRVLGSCIDRAASGPSTYLAALADCDAKRGRLMTWSEYRVLKTKPGLTWANGELNQYEFIDLPEFNGGGITPTAVDFGGNVFSDAGAQNYWHRCVAAL